MVLRRCCGDLPIFFIIFAAAIRLHLITLTLLLAAILLPQRLLLLPRYVSAMPLMPLDDTIRYVASNITDYAMPPYDAFMPFSPFFATAMLISMTLLSPCHDFSPRHYDAIGYGAAPFFFACFARFLRFRYLLAFAVIFC